ncbi:MULTISPECIES: MotA/TolQ/ExbB proton channel family protein [Cellulophaga]|uniref:MotA/TolQ/ExbB proton channel n=2 Tax=Cellulophaga TaxID=104264 RepID=F0RDV0_CELLC|nr:MULTISPECIES: MotA/TolQ/ExbB proton channel family protein [Cellulophaga]ADY29861.1 MotA/TolQ/ExbB proton channel [Cellulophaga lytica DSM 7489]AIM60860.1 biopolymer transporter ExbB [Cellulophaga lytica]APU10730.1 biopolymer transporter ExbB [Cellulophaga lytica]EWH15091.1 MotA/TolQ/ExbB proton channel [Cellulophaga geojensis KL-A]MDO6854565.1 MotA/TolQ/ExbB proton channel family protein [Cellulophaga lytica]
MLLFQDAANEVVMGESVSEEKTLSVIDLIVNGGAGSIIIIAILGILLFVALYIYFERIFAIKAASKIDKNFMNQIKDHVTNGKLEAARMLCAQTDSPVARLTEKGVSRIGKPLDDINTAIENAGTLEVYKLEKNVSVLATVAGAAPMIGFLGTVIGMILAFHEMASAGGQAEMGSLASGIYTAMTTTVAGLVVGIIAYIGYNHLVNRTGKVVHAMEANAVDFLDLLNEPL